MIGRAISHYRVLSALGSGGMGVVYLAEDERLGRQVALKFLPPDSARNRQALDRFRVEARAASSLSHPGICAIYDIGEDDGTPFIVMEALRGETLRDRINKGPVKVTDLLEIGIQLADALEAAHSQGIIHRDIKPSNIFVGDKNRAKILDFGLAKLSAGPTGPDGRTVDASTHHTIVKQITIPGSALGTVSYMSPEQARGEDVDTRTDLFSLGAVLYEMATGTQAFGGSTPAVVFDQILNHTPPVLAQLNPMVPPRLEAIIGTLLEKDRDLRYQHASDLQAELKRLRRDLDSGTVVGVNSSRTVVSTSAAATSAPTIAPPPTSVQSRSWRYGIALLTLLIVVAVGFTIWSGRSTGTPSSNERAVTTTPPAPAASTPAPAPAPQEPAPATPSATVATPPPARTPTAPPTQPQPPPSASTAPPIGPRAAGTPARGTAAPVPPPQKEPTPAPPVQTAQTAPLPPPAPATAPAPTPVTPAPAAVEPPPAPVSPPPQTQPAPPRAAETAPPPPARAAASEAPAAAVESDDALIRRVVATYKTAIETKNVGLFRSVRPGLSAAEEGRLRDSFRQIDSQQISIAIDEIRVDGRMATARISRQDVIMSGGRRQTQSSRQTLRFEKAATGWIITSIGG